MASDLKDTLVARIRDANKLYHRLILLVGPSSSGKTTVLRDLAASAGWPIVNLNLQLAERLLELTERQRALRVARILGDIVDETSADTVAIDNLELLFAADLKLDPLRLLQSLSRNRTIVASWPGNFDGETLVYAEPSHSEHRRYSNLIVSPKVNCFLNSSRNN